jgi:hypothetical protein
VIEIASSHIVEDLGPILLKRELWRMEGNPDTDIKAAYSRDGGYIGDWKEACYLHGRGIVPEAKPGSTGNVCSIGFCEREQKWYGWSHRALYGFGIGDVVEEGSCCCESLPVGFKAEMLDDARRMAIAFADCVA